MGWIFCGQHIKQVVQHLCNVESRGDYLLPPLRKTDRCAVCTKERQGRAAICCWKNPGLSFSPSTAESCRWLLRASGSHHTVLAHRAIFHRETGICTRRALGRRKVCPEDLLFSCLTQEKDNGFTDLLKPAAKQREEGMANPLCLQEGLQWENQPHLQM